MNSQIIQLDRTQNDLAIKILTQAFAADPMFNYFTRSESSKLRAIEYFSRSVLQYSQAYEQIYTTSDELKGIALWIPPGQFPLNDFQLLKLGGYRVLFNLSPRKIYEFLSLFTRVEKYHRSDLPQPHWYLLMLGVCPMYQSQGIGSLLIQPVLEQADRNGLSCYLETTTERGVRFYQNAGFEVLRTIEFARGNQRSWTMKREPRPRC